MNKSQLFVLGIGLLLMGLFLTIFPGACNALGMSDAALISCYIRRYAMTIPGLILMGLGILFGICSSLEPNKRA